MLNLEMEAIASKAQDRWVSSVVTASPRCQVPGRPHPCLLGRLRLSLPLLTSVWPHVPPTAHKSESEPGFSSRLKRGAPPSPPQNVLGP